MWLWSFTNQTSVSIGAMNTFPIQPDPSSKCLSWGLFFWPPRGTSFHSTLHIPLDRLHSTRYPTVLSVFSRPTVSLSEVAALSIVTSDNAAASCVLETVGVDAYLQFLESAGCENTGTPTGFSDEHFPSLSKVGTTADEPEPDTQLCVGGGWTRSTEDVDVQ